MATIDNQFHHSFDEQDFTASGEVDIKKLAENASGATSFTTVTSHGSAAGTTQITLDPYTNRSTTGDIRANAGWAINAQGADGMESLATDKRRIPAGTWTFQMTVSIPQAGTATGTLTVSFIVAVYRVSAAGARTLLFTATSDTLQSTGISGGVSGNLIATASRSEIILEAGETIHVGYLSNMVQVAGLAGATVAATATWALNSSTQFVQVPTGVRTQRIRSVTDSIPAPADSITRVVAAKRTLTESIPTTDTLSRQVVLKRTLTENIPTTDALTRSVGLNRTLTDNLATGGGGTTVIVNKINVFSMMD